MYEPIETFSSISPHIAEALGELMKAAVRVAAYGIERQPAQDRLGLVRAIEDEDCALTLQVNLPLGEVYVLVDGKMFAAPEVLFEIKLPEVMKARFDA